MSRAFLTIHEDKNSENEENVPSLLLVSCGIEHDERIYAEISLAGVSSWHEETARLTLRMDGSFSDVIINSVSEIVLAFVDHNGMVRLPQSSMSFGDRGVALTTRPGYITYHDIMRRAMRNEAVFGEILAFQTLFPGEEEKL